MIATVIPLVLALAAAVLAAQLLTTELRERDMAARMRQLRAPAEAAPARPALRLMDVLGRCGALVGRHVRLNPKDLAELESAVAAAGLDARRAVPAFLGTKALAAVLLPAAGLAYGVLTEGSFGSMAGMVAGGLALGVLAPNWVLAALRGPYRKGLTRGLPDALDLLVVCVEAGLGLETGVERVAREMRHTHPAIAVEFSTLAQELRLLPDRRETLARLGERSGLPAFRSFAATLSQTLRYGTPLGQALRVLAADMRVQRMTALEERAARLPALLVLPLILFIMPCLFIILIGPSALKVMDAMAGG